MTDFYGNQVEIYSNKFTFQFKRGPNREGNNTIYIEAAKKLDDKSHRANWRNKIQFTLQPETELVQFVTFLLGITNKVAFHFHNQKSLDALRNKDNSFLLTIGDEDKHSIVVKHHDQFHLLQLCTKPLAERYNVDTNSIMNTLRATPRPQESKPIQNIR